jgi:hypothetical protein
VLISTLCLGLRAGMLPQPPNEDELVLDMTQDFFVHLGVLWSLFVLEFLPSPRAFMPSAGPLLKQNKSRVNLCNDIDSGYEVLAVSNGRCTP